MMIGQVGKFLKMSEIVKSRIFLAHFPNNLSFMRVPLLNKLCNGKIQYQKILYEIPFLQLQIGTPHLLLLEEKYLNTKHRFTKKKKL